MEVFSGWFAGDANVVNRLDTCAQQYTGAAGEMLVSERVQILTSVTVRGVGLYHENRQEASSPTALSLTYAPVSREHAHSSTLVAKQFSHSGPRREQKPHGNPLYAPIRHASVCSLCFFCSFTVQQCLDLRQLHDTMMSPG
ncbi:hypothetical protein WMY93_000488 [Mugilogobius chulae]|uniref:Uncharacterized protein n=1 Tax=Mugilogobius chulae TaxID=88201 RepID=A0AAW0Q2J8_9GOBI